MELNCVAFYAFSATLYAMKIEDPLVLLSAAEERDMQNEEEISICRELVILGMNDEFESTNASLRFNPTISRLFLFILPLPAIAVTVSSDGQSMHSRNNFTSLGFRSVKTQSVIRLGGFASISYMLMIL